jgi:hypothetical protein
MNRDRKFRCDPASWTKGSHSLIEARATPAVSRAPIICSVPESRPSRRTAAGRFEPIARRTKTAQKRTLPVRSSRDYYSFLLPTVFQSSIIKGRQSTLQDIDYLLVNLSTLDGPTVKTKVISSVFLVYPQINDLFRICYDGQVGIVRHHNDLPSLVGALAEATEKYSMISLFRGAVNGVLRERLLTVMYDLTVCIGNGRTRSYSAFH